MTGTIKHTLHDGILTLTISYPRRKNAVTPAMLSQLIGLLQEYRDNSAVRGLLLMGDGDSFCAGFDVTSLPDADTVVDNSKDFPGADILAQCAQELYSFPLPSISVLRGPCFGAGGELALSTDFRIGTPGLKFCMPPAKLGLQCCKNFD